MDQDVIRLICFIIFTTFLNNLGLCLQHSKYTKYDIKNEKDCHINSNKHNKDLAVVINITVDHQSNADTYCRFIIKTNKDDGLFGVIQKMTFRRNKTQCLDYVQFKRSDFQRTQKFCGNYDRSTTKYYPVPEPENNTYESASIFSGSTYAEFDTKGMLETIVFISKEKHLLTEEIISLTLVYTPYKRCKENLNTNYTKIKFESCILHNYFCDGYQNCVPNICEDEVNCTTSIDVFTHSTGTKITMGAVTTLVVCTIIFGVCVWACKKKDMIFWSLDCAGPSTRSSDRLARSGVQESESTSNRQVPTAPMLEVVVPPPVIDKDLPPSYDSLFPEENNSTVQQV
ncbi:PREDICTED: uncharacterized protein LOC107072341 [Polistes dominula]|uniref:Uncharacterized protein LOC107072341 n=1 Tax=Polistes dominula TaxID=743375 RepID=A0ABM1J5E0_POLDO|nr:PREDICTED: uncharacterized protein LOC107072341 [Polistes dominula]XP_015187679.1 PREDICTED: uncharacterized protein LOC107072341 [Polistes dominula]